MKGETDLTMTGDPIVESELAGESELRRRLLLLLISLTTVLAAVAIRLFRPEQAEVASLFAFAGALLAAAPVFVRVARGLFSGEGGCADAMLEQFIALAILACLADGQFILASIVALILVIGQILEDRTILGTQRAVEGLVQLGKMTALRVRDGVEERVAADELRVGDCVRLRPGDRIPADGEIRAGRSAIDQSAITGESLPVEVAPGDSVYAGTGNLSGGIEIEVTGTGDETVIGHARSIVEEAQRTRAPILRLTERYAGYYFPFILMLCGAVLFFTADLSRAVSVLIVSLPCAFLLAAPSAMVAALASATRIGLLIKGVRFLEVVRTIDTVVFDKTGTLTHSRLRLVDASPAQGTSREELLAMAASALSQSSHPVARALVEAADAEGISTSPVSDIRERPGLGVEGSLDGEPFLAGRASWLDSSGISSPEPEKSETGAAVHFALAGEWRGSLHFEDTIRPEAAGIVESLRKVGVKRILMLTGDREAVARRVSDQLGLDEVHAECLPDEKLTIVEGLRKKGQRVLVVGDGINDAPALSAGHVSLAMGALGSQIAIEAADMALMSDDLHRIPDLFRLSRRTMGIIEQNLVFGAVFIALSIILSAAGWVSPIVAALLHEVSAFFVLFNSARLLRFEPHEAVGHGNIPPQG
ncbi:MAG: cation-translocating P-type ATPase, partial [Planctomycetota bacterium]